MKDKISVLMIGNSFSVDAAHFTHQLSLGTDVEIEVGVLYVGGCSLEQHVNGESTGKYIALKDALNMKEWDYITLQQVSVFSGLKDTFYPYINELIEYVKQYQKNPTFVLHKTWPYQTGFDNTNFAHYNYSRETMYKCICETYDYVSKDVGINIIIRSGDAVESAIEKYGEHFHKDGFHLNDAGRYIAALTFVHTFNNSKPIKKLYIPESLTKDQCQKYEELVLKSL